MISTLSSSSVEVRASSLLARRVISEAESTANNHERILRMAHRHSRAARTAELKLLRAAVGRTFPMMPDIETRDNLFCSMFPETLSLANLADLDAHGWVLDKIEGIAANAWSLCTALYTPLVEKNELSSELTITFPNEPPPYVGADSGGDDLPGRADTLLLVFRDGEVLCFDACPLVPLRMRINDGRTGLDGELCVRRRALSDDEKARFINATREDAEFGAAYLEPQDGNEASDVIYELCYMAHDIMLADNKKQTLSNYTRKQAPIAQSPYSERLAKMSERLQPRPAAEKLWRQSAAVAGGERAAAAAYTKTAQELEIFRRGVCAQAQPYLAPILVMPKQPYRATIVRYAFYAKMRRVYGVRTDGLIFVGETQPFQPVFIDSDGSVVNPAMHQGRPSALKKYKPRLANSFDAKLVRSAETNAYELYACDRATPVPSAGVWYGADEEEIERTAALGREAVAANMQAADAQLFRPDARGGAGNGRSIWHVVVCECNPYISAAAERAIAAVPPPASKEDEERYINAVAVHIRWQPVLERLKKRRANTYANFCGIVKAIGLFPGKEDICAHMKQAIEAKAHETAVVAAAAAGSTDPAAAMF